MTFVGCGAAAPHRFRCKSALDYSLIDLTVIRRDLPSV